jgi:hypothetical protein
MTEPTVIRFEATEIEPALSGDLGFLTMQTREGKIVVWMRRPVFEHLAEQMRNVLVADIHNDPSHKDT